MGQDDKRATQHLVDQHCKPCTEGTPPLKGHELENMMSQIRDWDLVDEKLLTKTYKFEDYESSLDFVDEVGELAEQQGHHPEIHLSFGKVKIDLSTHKIGALSENDFIMAAKIDEIAESEN